MSEQDPRSRVADAFQAAGLAAPDPAEAEVIPEPADDVAGVDADLFALHAMGLTTPEEGQRVSAALAADPDRGLDLAEARASGDIRISQDMPVVRPSAGQPEAVIPDPEGSMDGPPPEQADLQLSNQRREQSALFSLDELDAMTGGSDTPEKSLNEPSGMVNLNALHAAQMSPGPTLVSAMPDAPSRRSPLLMIAVALLLVGAGGAGVYAWLQGQKPTGEQPEVAGGPAPTPVTPAATPRPLDTPTGTPAPAAAAADASVPDASVPDAAAPDAEVKVAKAPSKPSRPKRVAPKTSKTPEKVAEKTTEPAAKPKADPAPVVAKANTDVDDLLDNFERGKRGQARSANSDEALANDPLLPEKLSKSQILSVVKKGAGKVRQCKSRDPSVSGVAKVKVVIGRSGKISSADLLAGPVNGTPVGECVLTTVKGFQFAKFRGEPMPVTLPFAL